MGHSSSPGNTDNPPARRVEVKEGDQTVAAAQISQQPDGTARVSLHPPSGHIPPDSRVRLVDAVVETPEVRQSSRLEATIPLGDSVALERLRERAEEENTRPAGSTALMDATLPDPAPRTRTSQAAGRTPRTGTARQPSDLR